MRPGATDRPVASIRGFASRCVESADSRDAIADQADVAAKRRIAGAVDHLAAMDQNVEHPNGR